MSRTKAPAEIPALTGLRWLAATLVFLYHARFDDFLRGRPAGRWDNVLWGCGWAGVPIFFALSGFLLTMIYFDTFRRGVSAGEFKAYFLKRVARIYPLYYVLLFLAVGYFTLGPGRGEGLTIRPLDLATHLVMLHGFFGDFALSLVPPAWSLTVEESFYLLLPFLCAGLGAAARTGSGFSWRRLALGLVAVNAGLVGAGFLITEAWPNRPLQFLTPWTTTILGQMPTFSAGMAAGLLWHYRPHSRLFTSAAWSNLLGTAAVLLYLAGGWYFDRQYGPSPTVPSQAGFVGQAFFATSAALLLLALCGRSVYALVLGSRLPVYGGRVSYAFYLVHMHPLFGYVKFALGLHLPAAGYVFYQLVSILLYEVIERPAHGWLRRRWSPSARHGQAAGERQLQDDALATVPGVPLIEPRADLSAPLLRAVVAGPEAVFSPENAAGGAVDLPPGPAAASER